MGCSRWSSRSRGLRSEMEKWPVVDKLSHKMERARTGKRWRGVVGGAAGSSSSSQLHGDSILKNIDGSLSSSSFTMVGLTRCIDSARRRRPLLLVSAPHHSAFLFCCMEESHLPKKVRRVEGSNNLAAREEEGGDRWR